MMEENPWKDGLENPDHLKECDGCSRCDYLIDGFYMSCDGCGHWGQQDSDGWNIIEGLVYCLNCKPIDYSKEG